MNENFINNFWKINDKTILGLLFSAAKENPQKIYCKTHNETITYSDLIQSALSVSLDLNNLPKDQPVAILLPNSALFLIAYFAVLISGRSPALLNYLLPETGLQKMLNKLDPSIVISNKEVINFKNIIINKDRVKTHTEEINLKKLIDHTSENDTAAIMFSGGTTGLPKQINHTNKCLIKMVERMEWGWPTKNDEKWLLVAPFTHIYGFLTGVTNPLLKAGEIIIPETFRPDIIINLLVDEQISIFGGGPPAIYQALLSDPDLEAKKMPYLRVCPGGGAPFPLNVHENWKRVTGLTIHEGYGMTEIAPISVNTEKEGVKLGSAGKPAPDTIIQIVDIEKGENILSSGELGEIRIKGPHMMTEYDGNPEETALTIKNGFIHTGDIGLIDNEGFLRITDRKKDVIFVKGFNVFPREVEEELLSHSSISGACVVGKQDDRSGETPIAFVTLRKHIEVSEIKDYCDKTLLPYKVPSEFIILNELPLTPAKKVDRMTLISKLST